MSDQAYARNYRDVNFREHPEQYLIGRGEQGVLIAEPYKSEILPFWTIATPEQAGASAQTIFELFEGYKNENDFVGMDMARKFLQMGFTRSRRYANHASGVKHANDGTVKPQDKGSEQSLKARSAEIFYAFYRQILDDPTYKVMRKTHLKRQAIAAKRTTLL